MLCSPPPGKPLSSEALDSRKQFMSFVLTMMRGHHMEHGGALPAIDVAALEHLAWTFDGLHYLLWVSPCSLCLWGGADHT